MRRIQRAVFHWYLQNFIAIDQLLNTFFLAGWADETLSSRAHRMEVKRQPYFWWMASVIDAIFFWQKDHCKSAHRHELMRSHTPPEMRDAN